MPTRNPNPRPATALARELHASDPALSHAEIARRVTLELGRRVRPWQVAAALATSGKPGPRARVADPVRVELRLERDIADRARQYAEASGWTLAQWAEGCLIAGVEDADQQRAARAVIERRGARRAAVR